MYLGRGTKGVHSDSQQNKMKSMLCSYRRGARMMIGLIKSYTNKMLHRFSCRHTFRPLGNLRDFHPEWQSCPTMQIISMHIQTSSKKLMLCTTHSRNCGLSSMWCWTVSWSLAGYSADRHTLICVTGLQIFPLMLVRRKKYQCSYILCSVGPMFWGQNWGYRSVAATLSSMC